ncbi:hypothetical protein E1286_05360 [Nonomuraea terrae]|uniref:Uncharacterized protein n=1 Tax=Nonomuraea terrae TaxID=2530383 RepID=A0A4R4Z8P1_9ACTN|nr:hypothetical protein [Nonomuraea terrae]TDD54618.1 hypothetical protein E1286_05360 [Nonomuraea terrae]
MSQKRQTGPQTRRTFHENRIAREKNGVMRFWWAAWWAVAELKHLDRRDAAKAHEQGLTLANQLMSFASGLNAKHHAHLMSQRGGKSRASA